MKIKLLLLFLLVSPLVFTSKLVFAADDVVEGEDDVNVEDETAQEDKSQVLNDKVSEEEESYLYKPHPDADTYFMFTKPAGMGLELPSGKEVHFLVGFTNKGKNDFLVEAMDASFKYAMDFNFHLQNFSAIAYNKLVKPKEEATFSYAFFISEAYTARPYGLTINLYYKDAQGNQHINAVLNETISIVEIEEGLDGETFFLYVFLVAFVVLIIVGIHQFLKSMRWIKSTGKKTQKVEHNEIDYDWIPDSAIAALKHSSPKASKSPKFQSSPRARKTLRAGGDD